MYHHIVIWETAGGLAEGGSLQSTEFLLMQSQVWLSSSPSLLIFGLCSLAIIFPRKCRKTFPGFNSGFPLAALGWEVVCSFS